MDLIDRYIEAVGDRLPRKKRDDIVSEIKSLILDALDERCEGGDPPEEDVVAVLRDFGPPADVAARYTPGRRYLIGPRLFDSYVKLASIAVGVTTLGISLALVLQLGLGPEITLAAIGSAVLSAISVAIQVLGSITIAFAIIERLLPDEALEKLAAEREEWHPRDLPALTRDRASTGGSVAGVCGSVLALAVLNVMPVGLIGIHHVSGSGWQVTELLNWDAVLVFRPYWNALLAALLIHHTWLLVRRRWTLIHRGVAVVLGLASMTLLGFMVGAPLVDGAATGAALAGSGETLAWLAAGALRAGLIIAILATLVEMVGQIRDIVRMSGRYTPAN